MENGNFKMRYCPEKKREVSEQLCEDCLFYKPQNILNPCMYREKNKCDNCKEKE